MNLEPISDVFFDLDHTLWDFDKNSVLAFKQVFQRHHIDISLDDFQRVYEPINLSYWRKYRNNEISKTDLRRGRFREAFLPFGMDYNETELDALAVTYIEELPKNNYLFEGVTEVLSYLATKYRLHIITNGFEEVQHLKLKNSKIENYFRTVTTSEEAGVKKPHPEIFELALTKASATPGTSVMVGDSYEADIQGARAFGMKTIFYNYRNESDIPTKPTIKTIRQLMSYL